MRIDYPERILLTLLVVGFGAAGRAWRSGADGSTDAALHAGGVATDSTSHTVSNLNVVTVNSPRRRRLLA